MKSKVVSRPAPLIIPSLDGVWEGIRRQEKRHTRAKRELNLKRSNLSKTLVIMSLQPNADPIEFPKEPRRDYYDVAIIGGATSGAAISFFLSRNPDFKGSVLVVEKDPTLKESATRASNYCMRQQFATMVNVQIAQFAAEFVKNFQKIVDAPGVPDLTIRNFGYLYLADNEEFVGTLKEDLERQVAHGAGTHLVSKDEIAKLYPSVFNLDDVLLGSLNTKDEGEFDGWTIFQHLRRVATDRGVEYVDNEVIDITVTDDTVQDIVLKTGQRVRVGSIVNVAGTRSGQVSAMAGIHLPLEARQRYTYIFEGENSLNQDIPLTIDPSGVHFRPFGEKAFLAGAPPMGPEVGVSVDDFNYRGDVWKEKIEEVIVRRLPGIGRPKVLDSWIGHYDFNTFDHNAIIGPHSTIKNFLFCCGFSGHGSQQAPACGRGVAELIIYGKFKTLDLSPLSYGRIARNEPLVERAVI